MKSSAASSCWSSKTGAFLIYGLLGLLLATLAVTMRPYVSRLKRVILSNVMPFVPNHVLERKLMELGIDLKSAITLFVSVLAQNLRTSTALDGSSLYYPRISIKYLATSQCYTIRQRTIFTLPPIK